MDILDMMDEYGEWNNVNYKLLLFISDNVSSNINNIK